MIKGGYKIVSLNDIEIPTENGVTIPGIYNIIENNYRKPLLLSGIIIDGVEKADTFITVTTSDSNFTFTAYGKTYTVTSDNLVTIA